MIASAAAVCILRDRGAVRLDGTTLDQWTRASLGRHIGYLPQDVELIAATIENALDPWLGSPMSRIRGRTCQIGRRASQNT
jgi:ABC-type multidrug transport system fused ATPase/permease subunit